MKYLYQYALTTIFLVLFCEPTSSFWTNSFSGGSTNDVSNTNTGMHSCPKWANYFEVDNTTLDCKAPKLNSRTPFRLRADTFCDKICEEVYNHMSLIYCYKTNLIYDDNDISYHYFLLLRIQAKASWEFSAFKKCGHGFGIMIYTTYSGLCAFRKWNLFQFDVKL